MLLWGLLLPTGFGFVVSFLVTRHINVIERLALGYGLGFGLLALGMFFLNVTGIRFSLINTSVLLSGISLVSLGYLVGKNWPGHFSLEKPNLLSGKKGTASPLYSFEIVMIALLGFFTLSSTIFSLYWPVIWSDALTNYDFRAKVLAETQFFPEAARLEISRPGWIFLYPPMTSLVHAWLYLSGWANPKIFYPLLLMSLATIFYYSMRDYIPRYHCLLFTLILVTTPIIFSHSHHAYLNFPFTYYFSGGVFYLYRWRSSRKKGFLTLAGILLGIGSTVRRESLMFFLGCLVVLVYFSISSRRFFAPVLFALLYFSIAPLWSIYYTQVLNLRWPFGELVISSQIIDLMRAKKVALFLWKFVVVRFQLVFWTLILATLLYIKKVSQHRFLFFIVVSTMVLFGAGSYYYSLTFPDWEGIGGSAKRLFMAHLPIIWYFVALITAESSSVYGRGLRH